MTQSSPSPSSSKSQPRKSSGTLCLYRPEEAGNPRPLTPYVRFRLCRGFIDDLNRVLPIRVRIQLEGELSKGRMRGEVEGGSLRFRWEFTEA